MSRSRPVVDFPRNEQGLVDKFIGTSYDVVKKVHDHLDELINIGAQLESMPSDIKALVKKELDAGISAVNETISGIDTRLKDTEEMQTTVVETVEGIAAYMGEVDETLGSLDTRVKALETAKYISENTTSDFGTSNTLLASQSLATKLNAEIKEMDSTIEEIENKIKELG